MRAHRVLGIALLALAVLYMAWFHDDRHAAAALVVFALPPLLLAVPAWGLCHQFDPTGQRVMSLKLDARGRPVGRPVEVLGGWDAVAGVRPKGAPTGLAVDRAGRLWVVEDRNKTVLMVRPE